MMTIQNTYPSLAAFVIVVGNLFVAQIAHADFSFEEMEQLEASEQQELLELARKAAKAWNFSTAENYLKQAEQKGYVPDQLKAVRKLIADGRAKKADKERRERELAEKKKREQQARQAARHQSGGTSIISNSDMKNWCLGASGKYPDFCYSITNPDAKNACLGMTKYPDFCYRIKNGDIKNMCLSRTKRQYRDFCYSIRDSSIKNACLGMTRDNSFCYSVTDGRWKVLCAGIAMARNNCYKFD